MPHGLQSQYLNELIICTAFTQPFIQICIAFAHPSRYSPCFFHRALCQTQCKQHMILGLTMKML